MTAETDLVRVLQILRDLAHARDRLAPLNDHRATSAQRKKLISSPEGESAIFCLFLAIDRLLCGDRRVGEQEADEPKKRTAAPSCPSAPR